MITEGNALFLVCSPCLDAGREEHGVRIGQRTRVGWYEPAVPPKPLAAWFANHRACGGRNNPDHFKLAYVAVQNADQGKLKPEVNGADRSQAEGPSIHPDHAGRDDTAPA